MKWIRENWTESGPPKVGFFTHDHPSGEEILAGARRASEVGCELVGYEIIPVFGTIDTSVEWLRLAAKKPDWILGYTWGSTLAVMAKDAHRLDILGKGIKVLFGVTLDETLVPVVGEAIEGFLAHRYYPIANEPGYLGLEAVREAAKEYRGWDVGKVSHLYLVGWAGALVGVEGIRLALEEVGFENLNGAAIRDALCEIKELESGIAPPFRLSNDEPWYHRDIAIYECQQQGKFTRVSDWLQLLPRKMD